MGRTFTEKITVEDLQNKISNISNRVSSINTLTPTVEKDLNKVRFDMENYTAGPDGYMGCEQITGYHTLPNGLTYLGVTAGGDWECPLFFIIYWDGKKLRGYIPTDGNFWNTDTKTAYGSEVPENDEDDEENLSNKNSLKRFGVTVENLQDMDTNAILNDIQNRIVFNS